MIQNKILTPTKLIPTNEPSSPPSHPVCWWAGIPGSARYIVVREVNAFRVRAEAMRTLKCEAHELVLIQGNREYVEAPNLEDPTELSKYYAEKPAKTNGQTNGHRTRRKR